LSVVGDFANQIKKSGVFSLGDANRTLREFTILLYETALDFGVPNEELTKGSDQELHARGVTFDYASIEGFVRQLEHILESYGEKIRTTIRSHSSFNIHDIKQYIDKHYFEDIKIFMFTEKYFLSREYLMKLFKQEFGSGIYEYVQKVRMEKAVELLADPNLKIQDISEMLGYKDKNYFSKAFKNYYEMSPSEYRGQL
jgi:two-component system response regulator YesN